MAKATPKIIVPQASYERLAQVQFALQEAQRRAGEVVDIILETLGLDPTKQWKIDPDTHEVTESVFAPPVLVTNDD